MILGINTLKNAAGRLLSGPAPPPKPAGPFAAARAAVGSFFGGGTAPTPKPSGGGIRSMVGNLFGRKPTPPPVSVNRGVLWAAGAAIGTVAKGVGGLPLAAKVGLGVVGLGVTAAGLYYGGKKIHNWLNGPNPNGNGKPPKGNNPATNPNAFSKAFKNFMNPTTNAGRVVRGLGAVAGVGALGWGLVTVYNHLTRPANPNNTPGQQDPNAANQPGTQSGTQAGQTTAPTAQPSLSPDGNAQVSQLPDTVWRSFYDELNKGPQADLNNTNFLQTVRTATGLPVQQLNALPDFTTDRTLGFQTAVTDENNRPIILGAGASNRPMAFDKSYFDGLVRDQVAGRDWYNLSAAERRNIFNTAHTAASRGDQFNLRAFNQDGSKRYLNMATGTVLLNDRNGDLRNRFAQSPLANTRAGQLMKDNALFYAPASFSGGTEQSPHAALSFSKGNTLVNVMINPNNKIGVYTGSTDPNVTSGGGPGARLGSTEIPEEIDVNSLDSVVAALQQDGFTVNNLQNQVQLF
jgi:hypothetical protein